MKVPLSLSLAAHGEGKIPAQCGKAHRVERGYQEEGEGQQVFVAAFVVAVHVEKVDMFHMHATAPQTEAEGTGGEDKGRGEGCLINLEKLQQRQAQRAREQEKGRADDDD